MTKASEVDASALILVRILELEILPSLSTPRLLGDLACLKLLCRRLLIYVGPYLVNGINGL